MSLIEKDKKDKQRWLIAFGDHVRRMRKKQGLSGAQFGALLHMDKQNITRLEKGRVNPSVYLIRKICDVLDLKTTRDFWAGFKL